MGRIQRIKYLLVAAAVAIPLGLLAWMKWPHPEQLAPATASRPIEVLSDGYVGSQSCQKCHSREHSTWHRSYHRTMTKPASPQTVFGRFDGVPVKARGAMYQLETRGDEFWVTMDDPDGRLPERIQRQIVLVTGSHHMQVYWYETGQSRTLGQMPLVYLLEEQRWIPNESSLLSYGKHFGSEAGRWNEVCQRCHTTHPRARPQLERDNWDTRVAEFGIGCEACHGPGEEHIRYRNDSISHKQQQHDPILHPGRLSAKQSSDICGQCHSMYIIAYKKQDDLQFLQRGFRFRPGQDLLQDSYREILLFRPNSENDKRFTEAFVLNRYWPDGMVRVTGREYNGLIESPCFASGEFSCLSCHKMHQAADDPRPLDEWANDQLQVGAHGDMACLQCHAEMTESIAEHTHHPQGSTGSRCYNCHMPHTAYGLLKAIRSHEISSPSVRQTLQTGRPNACNLCHLDKPLSWTARNLTAWYGHSEVELSPERQTRSAALLWLIKGNAPQRALVAWNLGWPPAQNASGTNWLAPFLAISMNDPYDAVRQISYRSLRRLPDFKASTDFDFLASEDQRLKVIRELIETWESTAPADELPRESAVFFNADGRLQLRTILDLSAQRDNQLFDLLE